MPRVKLTVEYDGTNFVGWQVQDNGPSVQACLEKALQQLCDENISIFVSGRTDSGVHARGQVVVFDTNSALPVKAFYQGLNGFLPPEVAVVQAEFVAEDFDPRRWALGKRYQYLISNRRTRSPLKRLTHWEIFQRLDVDAMKRGAVHLLGKHDFSAFRASDCQARHAIRDLRAIEISGAPGADIVISVEGSAFLKHMVRTIVGTLVAVGRHRKPPEWVREILVQKDRTKSGQTAPPHGLCLEEVFYGKGPREGAADA